jgi:hypothetical protein
MSIKMSPSPIIIGGLETVLTGMRFPGLITGTFKIPLVDTRIQTGTIVMFTFGTTVQSTQAITLPMVSNRSLQKCVTFGGLHSRAEEKLLVSFGVDLEMEASSAGTVTCQYRVGLQ